MTLPSEDVQDGSWWLNLPAYRLKTFMPRINYVVSHSLKSRPDTHSPTETTGLKLENKNKVSRQFVNTCKEVHCSNLLPNKKILNDKYLQLPQGLSSNCQSKQGRVGE